MSTRRTEAAEPQTIRILDRVDGREGLVKVEVVLIKHMKHLGDNSTSEGRWSASFSYFDLRCVLRERKSAAIQCKAKWLDEKSGVKSTGKKTRREAIQWAAEEMRKAHFAELQSGHESGVEEPQATDKGLRLSEAIFLLRDRNLLPGSSDPEASAEDRKRRAPYDLILDIAQVVWDEDPFLSKIGKDHIRRMYKARVRPETNDEDKNTEDGENGAGEEAGDQTRVEEPPPFQWPAHLAHRKPINWVKPQTVQGDLHDLKSAFGKLLKEEDAAGKEFLSKNPLAKLELGEHEKDSLPEAGPHRYRWVIRYADEAVERIRTDGFKHTEWRRYTRGEESELKPYIRTEKLPGIVPGMLRFLLVLQFGHPTRPRSIRHIRVKDTARTRSELVRLLYSLELKDSDKKLGEEVFDLWSEGGIAYRRRWSKLNTERLVPFSEDIAAEFDRYMEKRAKWLGERNVESVWLFPSPRDPRRPINGKDAGFLLACGEDLAREKIAEAGLDPVEFVRKLHKTGWYAYRRFWKTLRNRMGWEANSSAAYVGDWTTKEGSTADVVYARFSPRFILAVVEGKTILEALADDDGMKEIKRAARIRPDIDEEVGD